MTNPEIAFVFRLAWTLKKSVVEILALPVWEREAWRMLFDVAGPLDWEREDWFDARRTQYASSDRKTLREFRLFAPLETLRPQTEDDVFKMFS